MRNKITKLSLLLIVLSGISAKAQYTGNVMTGETNVEALKVFGEQKNSEYQKAVQIAKDKGMPISGVENGKTFGLAGIDEVTGNLIYISTTNNSPTKSSLQTANAKSLHARGISGVGVKVGMWDGGHPLSNHLAFAGGRYIIKESAAVNFHGAHVAGTIAAGEFGDKTAKGFAYNAKIYGYEMNNDIAEMTPAASSLNDRIYLSNHSYGLDYIRANANKSVFGQYNSRTRDYDVLANLAPDYTIVFAAGNDRSDARIPKKSGGKDLLSFAGVAKNTVVVAATEGTDTYAGITGLTSVTMVAGVGPFISSFSNYGPTDDYRIKPDIAAKGVDVTSVGVASASDVDVLGGTSMAAPAVTGVFALWHGYYNELYKKNMSSASTRALMAHTARETGPAPGPDFMFGWGLINAAKGVEIMDNAVTETSLFNEFTLTDKAKFEYKFPYTGTEPLIVTIAWNDPAGTVTTQEDLNLKKLVNDLDLRLVNEDTGAVFYPWSLNKDWTILPNSNAIATRLVDNDRDNIEKIEPQGIVAGNYKIVVTHKGSLSGTSQDFALVVSGAGGKMPKADGNVSVEDVALQGLKIYPNPVDSNLYLGGDVEVLNGADARIIDMSGRVINSSVLVFDGNNTSIDVSSLQSGTYILMVSKAGAAKSYKFIKK